MNNQLNKTAHILLSPVTAYMFVGTVLLFITYKVERLVERLSHHHCPPHGSSFVAQKWFDDSVWVTIAFPVTFPVLASKAILALTYHILKTIIHHLYIHLWGPFKIAYLSLGSMLLFRTYKMEKLAERCAGHHSQGKTSFHATEWHNRGFWWTVQFPIVWPVVTLRAALILVYYSTKDLLYYLGELIDTIWEYCKRLLNHLWNLINDAWRWICDALHPLVEYIIKVVRWFVVYAKKVVRWIVELVKPLYDQIVRYFIKIWTPIIELIKKVWRWISPYVVNAWRLVVKVVTAIWNRITYYTRIIWLRIVSLVKGIGEWISHYLSKAWRLVLRLLNTMWRWIVLMIWRRIEMILSFVFDCTKELLKAILKHIKSTVLSIADTAKKGLYLIVKTVKKIS